MQVTPVNRTTEADRPHALQEKFTRLRKPLAELPSPTAVPEWMQVVLQMDESAQTASSLDVLFDQINWMLSESEFGKVDEVIAVMPVEGPSLSLMMGLLSITRPAAEHLPSRQRFFDRVYRLCKAMRRDAESLLGGLK